MHFCGAAILGIIESAIHYEDYRGPAPCPPKPARQQRSLLPANSREDCRTILIIHAGTIACPSLRHLVEKALLDGGVILHAAMTVDMVGRQRLDRMAMSGLPRPGVRSIWKLDISST